jgi:DNA-binding HxlR family transcriptional regulator
VIAPRAQSPDPRLSCVRLCRADNDAVSREVSLSRTLGATPSQGLEDVVLAQRQAERLQDLAQGIGRADLRRSPRALSTRDSDITRLLDRLELLGFVARRRERPDRRVVRTQITEQGTGVLDAVDKLVGELQVRHLGHLGPKKLSVQRAAEVGGDHWAHRMKVAKTDTEVSDECFRE